MVASSDAKAITVMAKTVIRFVDLEKKPAGPPSLLLPESSLQMLIIKSSG